MILSPYLSFISFFSHAFLLAFLSVQQWQYKSIPSHPHSLLPKEIFTVLITTQTFLMHFPLFLIFFIPNLTYTFLAIPIIDAISFLWSYSSLSSLTSLTDFPFIYYAHFWTYFHSILIWITSLFILSLFIPFRSMLLNILHPFT